MTEKTANKSLTIDIDTTEMTPAQKRMLKTLNLKMVELLTTTNESEYFNCSAEAIRICAAMIKQAGFITRSKDFNDIPYDEQAIEFSLELLQEHITSAKVVTWDN
jgi:hypothetical protein